MDTQTTTIKVSNGTIRLPERWASLLNGHDVVIARIDDMFVVKPQRSFKPYTDEEIASWKNDDLISAETRLKLEQLLSAT